MAREIVNVVGQQAHCCNSQASYSDKLQYLGFPNPSQLAAARTILAAVSASCLNQPTTDFKENFIIHKLTLLVATRPTLVALAAHQRITKSSLPVVSGSSLAEASTHVFHQLGTKP